jgi:hypothetical protein
MLSYTQLMVGYKRKESRDLYSKPTKTLLLIVTFSIVVIAPVQIALTLGPETTKCRTTEIRILKVWRD